MLERLKLILKNEVSDELARFLLDLAEEKIKNYCNIDTVPEGLSHTWLEMAAALSENRNGGAVSSIKEGDTQINYSTTADEILDSYKPQLNRYRRIGAI